MLILMEIKWLFIFLFRITHKKKQLSLCYLGKIYLKPADGAPITLPDKEMAIGIFYLTTIDESLRVAEEEEIYLKDSNEALLAYSEGKIMLRQPIKVRIEDEIIETTVGRLMLNEHLPQSLGFVNEAIKASGIKNLITRAMHVADSMEVERLIDRIKTLGFYGSTISGISVSVFDTALVAQKNKKLLMKQKRKLQKLMLNIKKVLLQTKKERGFQMKFG